MRTKANMLGGFGNYTQIETLNIMKESVKNPGMNGMAHAGMGLGMGLLGNVFANNMQGVLNNQTQFYQPQQTNYNQGNNQPVPPNNTPSQAPNGQAQNQPNQQSQPVTPVVPVTETVTEKAEPTSPAYAKLKEIDYLSVWKSIPKTAKFCMECGTKVVLPEPPKTNTVLNVATNAMVMQNFVMNAELDCNCRRCVYGQNKKSC